MSKRPDQENWDTLQASGEQLSYGWMVVKLTYVDGKMVSWEEQESRRGHKAPLRKENGSAEENAD